MSSGFPLDASWDEWVEGTVRGWAYELRALKHYLERHEGQDRRALLLRRRVRLPREEVWSRLTGAGGLAPRWISLWGEDGSRMSAIEEEWTATLERVFPEGRTMREAR